MKLVSPPSYDARPLKLVQTELSNHLAISTAFMRAVSRLMFMITTPMMRATLATRKAWVESSPWDVARCQQGGDQILP